MLTLAQEMRQQQQQGSILSLLCDAGERYLPTYHDETWVTARVGDCAGALQRLQALLLCRFAAGGTIAKGYTKPLTPAVVRGINGRKRPHRSCEPSI
jgi:hypothetical protein